MNTHQKAFFVVVTTVGCMAMALASPAPQKSHVLMADLPAATVIGHRHNQELVVEKTMIIGHRSDAMLADRTANTATNG